MDGVVGIAGTPAREPSSARMPMTRSPMRSVLSDDSVIEPRMFAPRRSRRHGDPELPVSIEAKAIRDDCIRTSNGLARTCTRRKTMSDLLALASAAAWKSSMLFDGGVQSFHGQLYV